VRFPVILSIILAVSLAMISPARAEDQAKADSSTTTPVELKNQTHCPVMGGKIDSTAYTDIQGQRVYHCCPMCSAKLKKDPDKYFKKAAAKGVLFENIQTFCPVSGEKLEKKEVYTDFEGRRIYFCCKKCRGTFGEDPEKYLTALDAAPQPEAKAESEKDMKMDHDSHHH
jgi:YHS domain-containing protein